MYLVAKQRLPDTFRAATAMRNSIRGITGQGGQILVITAVTMTGILGITALSIDASYMYEKRHRLYAAADAAAKTGAIEVKRNPTITHPDLDTFANQQVTANGFNPGAPTSVIVRRCNEAAATCTGIAAGKDTFVEALVSEPTNTFFGRLLGWLTATPGARAVAGPGPAEDCLVVLKDFAGSPEALDIGNMTMNVPNCGITVNGDLQTNPPTSGAAVNAQSVGVHIGCLGPACPQPREVDTVPAVGDPLLGKYTRPANPGGCVAVHDPTSPLDPGCYSSITTSANQTVILRSGIFYVPGPILIGQNNTVRSEGFPSSGGVLIFLAGAAPGVANCTMASTAGCIDVGNNPTFELTAMMSGPYTALLMWQAGTATPNRQNATFDGNMGISNHYDLRGAMYFPDASVSFRNGLNATNDCMLFVSWTLAIGSGTGNFSNVCAGFGGSPLQTISLVE
jgi:Flp pilus assembly protein TadG